MLAKGLRIPPIEKKKTNKNPPKKQKNKKNPPQIHKAQLLNKRDDE